MRALLSSLALLTLLPLTAACAPEAPPPAEAETAPAAPAEVADPIIGSWQVDLARSTYSPGPPPKSDDRVYEDRGGGLIVATFQGTNAQGQPFFNQYSARYDGGEYPFFSRGSTTVGTITFRRIDPRTVEATQKEDGKQTITTLRTISEDGSTMTFTQTGTNARGQAVNNTIVYSRK